MRRGDPTSTMPQAFENLKSDYQAAKFSRFRRRRMGLNPAGSGADYHYRNESDYLRVMEYARDMDRNDGVIGPTVGTAVNNIVQGGFTLDPQTGDRALDADLVEHWKGWAEDPDQCDAAGEMTWHDIENMSCRSELVDGDILGLPLESGALQMVEAHRLRTPSGTKKNVVCGVLLDEQRRRLEYWLTRDDIDPMTALRLVSDVTRYPARDAEGNRQIFHIYHPKRVSQTRGISALAPVFDYCGMFEDIQFATLVKQQVSSFISIFREMDAQGLMQLDQDQLGEIVKERLKDGSTRVLEGMAPGLILQGLPGERLHGFSPNIPSQEWFLHMKFVLQIIGINLGLPLVVVLLDAKETNFSGWRGAIDQARTGWRENQRSLRNKLHAPVYRWKLRQWIGEERALAAAERRLGAAFYKHQWGLPQWPYIEPLKDAQADAMKVEKHLTSPRRLHAQRGQDFGELAAEIVGDNKMMLELALKAAAEINTAYPEAGVGWRDLLNLTAPPQAAPAAPEEDPPAGKKKAKAAGQDAGDDDNTDPEDGEE